MLEFLNKIREEHADDESLIAINEIETELTEKKYGLVWEEHEERVDIEMQTNVPVFTELFDKEIVSDVSLPFNFLLEGDNLHSLKLLEKTHKGMIDLVYIDPPYNTKEKDFYYDDTYVGEDDYFRHSKWLSFMSERLKIAKNLLTGEGVIFIQINDIEFAQLKILCDDIFGEDNFLNIISVNMKNIAGASGGGEDKRFKKNCEYILVYTKNYSFLPIFNGPYSYTEIYSVVEQYREQGKNWHYTSAIVDKGQKNYVGSTVDGDGNEIKIYTRKNAVIKSIRQIMEDDGITEKEAYYKYGQVIFEAKDAQSSIRQRVIQAKTELGVEDDIVSIDYVPKTGKNKGRLYEQFYKGDKCRLFAWLKDISEDVDGILYKKDLQGTYWDFTSRINNVTKEGNVEFSNGKKPEALIQQIVSLYPATDITVLDFFAGSGTTGHAVIEQNKEDGGNRRFILCDTPDICREKTYPRLINVINGYITDSGKMSSPNTANLKYYHTDFVSKIPSDDDCCFSTELLQHIEEMVQLEYAVKLDGTNFVLLLTDEEADTFIADDKKFSCCKALYVSTAVLLTAEQSKKIAENNKKLFIIPDYYFESELLEVGER